MTTCDVYRYQTLSNPRSIRLVVLHRDADSSLGQGLRCDLVETSVDSPPSYLALSYTWGGEIPSEPLIIQNALANRTYTGSNTNSAIPAAARLSIAPNCAMALSLLQRSMKGRFKTRHPISVWVDAICIDQSNTEERSIQVAIMAEIYDRAKRVVVWLGESYAPESWSCLAVSKPLSILPRIEYDHNHGQRFNQRFKRYTAKMVLKVCDVNLYEWQTTDCPFRAATNQLRRILSMRASEPRDKIFALRALSPGVLGKMSVDYQRPTGDVFHEATRLMVEEEKRLRVLYFSNRAKTTAGVPWDTLPSWTVDFATEDAEMRGSHKHYYNSLGAASGGSKPVFAFAQDGRSVRLRGVRVGRVASPVSDIFPASSKCMQGGGCVSGGKFEVKGEKEEEPRQIFQHVCRSPYLDVLERFMKDVACRNEPDSKVDKMGSSLCRLLRWIIQGPKKPGWPSSTSSSLEDRGMTAVSSLVEWDSRHFGSQCRVALRVGRLFFTSDQVAGFAVTSIREGDVVCLIAGLDHPFILRPRKGYCRSYTLVGPTIFAGAMGGEMWPTNEEDLEDFEVV